MSIVNEYSLGNSVDGEMFIIAPFEIRKTNFNQIVSHLEARLFDMSPADYLRQLEKKYQIRLINYHSFIGYNFNLKEEAKRHLKELNQKYKIFRNANAIK